MDWSGVPKNPWAEFTDVERQAALPMLRPGDKVVWVEQRAGVTWKVSLEHRIFDGNMTYCLKSLPLRERVLPTGLKAKPCLWCQKYYQARASYDEILSDRVQSVPRSA